MLYRFVTSDVAMSVLGSISFGHTHTHIYMDISAIYT